MYSGQSLSHTRWECKFHVVWIPKYRKKVIYVSLRKYLGEILRELATQNESEILEGHHGMDTICNCCSCCCPA
jgi:putative transposase